MSIFDVELQKLNLRCVSEFNYYPGDCLFDTISYLLNYREPSLCIRQHVVAHLEHCLAIGTPEALLCRNRELQPAFMHDLHQGQVTSEFDYLSKMALSARAGGLWGDFTILFWISQYLQCPILVWNKRNGRIMSRIGEHFTNATLQLAFGNDHYKPIVSSTQVANNHVSNDLAENINSTKLDAFKVIESNIKYNQMKRNGKDLLGTKS